MNKDSRQGIVTCRASNRTNSLLGAGPPAQSSIAVRGLSSHPAPMGCVVFAKGYRGALELRAFDGDGGELGRSNPTDKLEEAPDSAKHLVFKFDPATPMARAERYVLHPVKYS